jgi:hypothetical protein
VNNFLHDDDVRRDMPIFNKRRLRVVNKVRNVRFKSVSKGFRYNFVNDIAKTYRPKILRVVGCIFLGIKVIKVWLISGCMKVVVCVGVW